MAERLDKGLLDFGILIEWKKYQVFSEVTEKFLEHLQAKFLENRAG